MADNKNPQDDHIEDLLSQLQGIFGKLSRQEEEESKEKLDAALLKGPFELKPPTLTPRDNPPLTAAPSPVSPPPFAAPAPAPVTPPPVAPPPVAEPVPAAVVPDASQLGTIIAYPAGRETEAKSLLSKLETITPKFTKVAFRLKVTLSMAYDPKGDWKDTLIQQAIAHHAKTLFIILDRPLEDARRKALIVDVESHAMYFQEVPLLSIEKKAFYTDVLLGLVFFMDSQKPGPPEQAA